MNQIKINIALWVVMLALVSLWSCQDDELKIPTPSTQAYFDYEVETFYLNEETGEMNYEVRFNNNSQMAATYFWDFGNGQTSDEADPGVVVYETSGSYDVTLEVTPLPEQDDLDYNNLQAEAHLLLVPTVFFEGFEDPGLAQEFPPQDWFMADLDGDGRNWYWDEFPEENETYILSESWDGEALEPDNWIVSPAIDLSDVEGGLALEWDVTPTANTPDFRQENYSVLITTDVDIDADSFDADLFEEIFTERLTPEMENWVWINRMEDISEYTGQQIRIAFRHHDSSDNDRIGITNIHVFQTGD